MALSKIPRQTKEGESLLAAAAPVGAWAPGALFNLRPSHRPLHMWDQLIHPYVRVPFPNLEIDSRTLANQAESWNE